MEITNKVIWFFGLSGAGKTTLAKGLSKHFTDLNKTHFILDGDILRDGINKGLGFSREDRRENIRRISEISKLLLQLNVIPIVAAISPYKKDRQMAEEIIGKSRLFWVYVECPLSICEERDPKGLYKLARRGDISNFTGLSDPFCPPEADELVVNTSSLSINDCVNKIIKEIV